VTGIIKFDLHAEPQSGKKELEVGGNVEGIYELGPGRFGSEAVFVPEQPGLSGEEDDGYLIFFVHDENTGYSSPWLCTLLSLLCVDIHGKISALACVQFMPFDRLIY
jgi:hypothetical protein